MCILLLVFMCLLVMIGYPFLKLCSEMNHSACALPAPTYPFATLPRQYLPGEHINARQSDAQTPPLSHGEAHDPEEGTSGPVRGSLQAEGGINIQHRTPGGHCSSLKLVNDNIDEHALGDIANQLWHIKVA